MDAVTHLHEDGTAACMHRVPSNMTDDPDGVRCGNCSRTIAYKRAVADGGPPAHPRDTAVIIALFQRLGAPDDLDIRPRKRKRASA